MDRDIFDERLRESEKAAAAKLIMKIQDDRKRECVVNCAVVVLVHLIFLIILVYAAVNLPEVTSYEFDPANEKTSSRDIDGLPGAVLDIITVILGIPFSVAACCGEIWYYKKSIVQWNTYYVKIGQIISGERNLNARNGYDIELKLSFSEKNIAVNCSEKEYEMILGSGYAVVIDFPRIKDKRYSQFYIVTS